MRSKIIVFFAGDHEEIVPHFAGIKGGSAGLVHREEVDLSLGDRQVFHGRFDTLLTVRIRARTVVVCEHKNPLGVLLMTFEARKYMVGKGQ